MHKTDIGGVTDHKSHSSDGITVFESRIGSHFSNQQNYNYNFLNDKNTKEENNCENISFLFLSQFTFFLSSTSHDHHGLIPPGTAATLLCLKYVLRLFFVELHRADEPGTKSDTGRHRASNQFSK